MSFVDDLITECNELKIKIDKAQEEVLALSIQRKEKLAELFERSGLSVIEIAERCSMTRMRVYQILNDDYRKQ